MCGTDTVGRGCGAAPRRRRSNESIFDREFQFRESHTSAETKKLLTKSLTPKNDFMYMYINTYNCHFFFLRAYLFVLAPLSEKSDGVGTIRPSRSRCRRFGRDPCSVSRVASIKNVFWPWAHLRQTAGESAISPGIGFLHPLSPCTHVRFGCKPGFSARRGSYFCTEHHATILPPSSSPAPQQQQPATLCACSCCCSR